MVSGKDANSASIELLRNPWESQLVGLVSEAEEFLLLASPFITRTVTERVGEELSKKRNPNELRFLGLTNIRVDSVLSGSLELDGLIGLCRSFPNFVPIHLPSLHAKVFVADTRAAIVTSGNLTSGGLRTNYEYGVLLRDQELVRSVRADLDGFARLGARVQMDGLVGLAADLDGLKKEFKAGRSGTVREGNKALKNRLRKAEDQILEIRAKGGSNQAIFSMTIEYVLAKGPLTTAELHPLIQQLHPDLCDDSVDRVIDGVSFGKRWKHWVRSAQQFLKRNGRISFDGSRWRLAEGASK